MKNKKQSWIVRLECVVTKEVITDDCTEQEARENPFGQAVDEREVAQMDWEVKRIEPNN